MWIFNLGNKKIILQNDSQMYASVISPNADLVVQNGSDFYGSFVGESIFAKNGAGVHIDTGRTEVCGVQIEDTMGTWGAASAGGISSPDTFAQWYTDVPVGTATR